MLIAALSSVPAAPTALLPDASVGHGGGDLRQLLSLRCPGADDGCRSSARGRQAQANGCALQVDFCFKPSHDPVHFSTQCLW